MALWTTDEIATELWVDFSDAATLFDDTSGGSVVGDGEGIGRAEDKSGNARHFVEATAGNRPTWMAARQNGIGAAEFDGGDRLSHASLSAFNFMHRNQTTSFVVAKSGVTASPVAAYGWFGSNGFSSSNRGVYAAYDNRNILTGMVNSFNSLVSNGAGVASASTVSELGTSVRTEFRSILQANAYQLHSIVLDPQNATAANRMKIAVNGGGLVGNSERVGASSLNNAAFNMQIGAVGNNLAPLLGDFCELIFCAGVLASDQIALVQGYLAWKWGLQANLPADHPYKNSAPRIGGGGIIPILRQHYAAQGAR
jgi:hypothetical protein